MGEELKPPFPWFGGKSRAAALVWQRFGDVANYVEPFFGSGAVLLRRPHAPKVETVNDLDCLLANFWRSVQADPDGVAYWADQPVNEADLHARHLWLLGQVRDGFRKRMHEEADFHDVKVAGWWVWGQSAWIGAGWCTGGSSWGWQQLPHLGTPGMGVHRPSRKLPHLGDPGRGVKSDLYEYIGALSERMRKVRVCCGDWSRVLGPTPTFRFGLTGVLLDPPYPSERRADVYAEDDATVAFAVAQWARDNGDNPKLRIALCGYEGEHQMPETWCVVRWKAAGGYGSQGDGLGRENAARETIWFSPHCVRPEDEARQSVLFEGATA